MIFVCLFLQLVNGLPQSLRNGCNLLSLFTFLSWKQIFLTVNRNDISREFKDIIGQDVVGHLEKLKSEVHLIEDDIKQSITEMSKFAKIEFQTDAPNWPSDRLNPNVNVVCEKYNL